MNKAKILQSEKITDRDIFNYIAQQMIKQGTKSTDQWYNEEDDIFESGDDCRYFGYDMRNESAIRCAVGWIMDKDIFNAYEKENCVEIEGNGIQTTEPLEVVILSNENWEFTKESWVMLSILQRVHDTGEDNQWEEAFHNMSFLFNSDGKFCPNYAKKNSSGDEIDFDELYRAETSNCVKKSEHYIDLEHVGISLKIPSHAPHIVQYIADAINRTSPDEFQANILEVENEQVADISAKNFLDIMDAVRLGSNHMKMVVNANQ